LFVRLLAPESPRDSGPNHTYRAAMLPEQPPLPPPAGPVVPGAPEPPADPVATLTPEEQLARYEEALKESDWGHQPC